MLPAPPPKNFCLPRRRQALRRRSQHLSRRLQALSRRSQALPRRLEALPRRFQALARRLQALPRRNMPPSARCQGKPEFVGEGVGRGEGGSNPRGEAVFRRGSGQIIRRGIPRDVPVLCDSPVSGFPVLAVVFLRSHRGVWQVPGPYGGNKQSLPAACLQTCHLTCFWVLLPAENYTKHNRWSPHSTQKARQ